MCLGPGRWLDFNNLMYRTSNNRRAELCNESPYPSSGFCNGQPFIILHPPFPFPTRSLGRMIIVISIHLFSSCTGVAISVLWCWRWKHNVDFISTSLENLYFSSLSILVLNVRGLPLWFIPQCLFGKAKEQAPGCEFSFELIFLCSMPRSQGSFMFSSYLLLLPRH